jgi:hypothetical protein
MIVFQVSEIPSGLYDPVINGDKTPFSLRLLSNSVKKFRIEVSDCFLPFLLPGFPIRQIAPESYPTYWPKFPFGKNFQS